ncbi:hypothetical protein KEM56_000843 [Ascosphaera pollenicola]|nr:hypothetical protein KEM56_000843 [Ascosphaera pollenicola]
MADLEISTSMPQGDVPMEKHPIDNDEAVMRALGYKQEFKREFTLWTSFAVSFSVLGLLPSFASTLTYGMGYAGTAGMVYGWIIAMFFIQCVAMGMAELCSSMPTSGGLYYAAAVLAPDGWGAFAAWITGWSNWICQITAAPSCNFSMAGMVLAAVSIMNPDYIPQNWHTYLLTVMIMIIHAVISSMPTQWIARVNSWGSAFNVIALVIVIITIPAAVKTRPKFTPAAKVWGTIENGTDWPDGVAVLMSFVSVIWTMSGYDSPFHLSEECSNAAVSSPRAIVMTSGLGGLMGWFLQIVVAYTVVDIDEILNDSLGQPWGAYLFQVLPKNTALAMLCLTIVCGFSMGQGCMIAASRVTYAYARDGCFPFSNIWGKVNPYTDTPVNAVWMNTVLGILACLLLFAGDVAIGALFSIGGIGAFVAFSIPIAIRVCFPAKFVPGPWNLGKLSRPIGFIGSIFVLLMIPILCLPPSSGKNLNPQTMNWTCLVYGSVMGFCLVWYAVSARKWFNGPKINVDNESFDGVTGNIVIQGVEGPDGQKAAEDTVVEKKIAEEAKSY